MTTKPQPPTPDPAAHDQQQTDEHVKQRTDAANAKADELAPRLKAAWKLYDATPLDTKQKTHPGIEQVLKDLLFEDALNRRRAKQQTGN